MINSTVLKTAALGRASASPAEAPPASPVLAEIVHHVPGRLHLRATSLKGNARASAAVHGRLQGVPGVTAVTVNSCTGSLVIEYDRKRLSLDGLLTRLGRRGVRAAAPGHVAAAGQSPLPAVFGRVLAEALVQLIVVQLLAAIV
ncbi:MAG TPA: hypothetical protein VE397_08605 [Stellaceae bacterium]|jgi:hypothetical protein|nr:hypothetical protein [Stellaceae bacterium]